MDEIHLSVIIVTYLSRGEIAACLESIPRRVRGGDVEVIVVENCSGDGLVDLVSAQFPWVRCVSLDRNAGFGSANNIGYELSGGKYVLFLNPDTVSSLEVYEHCLDRLRADHSIGVISPRLEMPDGEMDLACRRSIPTIWDGFCRASGLAARFPGVKWFAGYNLTYLPDDGTYDVGSVNGAFMMSSRGALLRVGVFDEQFFMYGDDLDLNYRFHKAGYRVVYDGRVQMIHIKGASSSKEPEKMARAVFSSTKQFYLKHFNPKDSKLIALKYSLLFRLWELVSLAKARMMGYQRARPL